VGENVFVGAQTTVGPGAILEHDSFVECGARIERSLVGADTLVGEFTEIRDSIALGSTLVNWRLDSAVEVPDEFLLCSLARRQPVLPPPGAVRPRPFRAVFTPGARAFHYQLTAARGALRSWPQLWNVARAAYSLITGAPDSTARRRIEPAFAPQARSPRAALK
jgi:hypothetical protein